MDMRKVFAFLLILAAMPTNSLFGMSEKKDVIKVLITIYGGLNGFAEELKLDPKKRGVARRSYERIKDILEKRKSGEKNLDVTIEEGFPSVSNLEKYAKYDQCIHIQPGGNMHNQYGRNIKNLLNMRKAIVNFVEKGGHYLGICAGAILVGGPFTYYSQSKNGYTVFDPKDEDPKYIENGLYKNKMKIPEWPGKKISEDIIPLSTQNGYIAQYFGGPVFDEKYLKDDAWNVLDTAYLGSTKQDEPIAISKKIGMGEAILISPHYEFPGGDDKSCDWLYKIIMAGVGKNISPEEKK